MEALRPSTAMKNFACCYLFLLLIIISIACDIIEDLPINPDPVHFTIEFEGDRQLLHGQERVWVESEAIDRIRKVSFYLDGTLIGEETEAPFAFIWNTDEHPDGSYALRAVVEDRLGRKTENSAKITISNTLFTVSLPDVYKKRDIPYLSGAAIDAFPTSLWVYITDEEGSMIGKALKLTEGEQASWKRPKGFTGSISYHELWHRQSTTNPNLNYHNLYTYTHFPKGAFHKEPDYPEAIGSATISFRDDQDENSFTYVKNRGIEAGFARYETGPDALQVPVFTSRDKIVAYYFGWDNSNNEQSLQYAFADASAGDALTLNYSNFLSARRKEISWSFEDYGNIFAAAYWMVDGYPTLIDYIESRYGGEGPQYYIPADDAVEVSYVKARLSYKDGDYEYVLPYEQMGNNLNAVTHSARVERRDNNSFHYSIQGDPDVVYAYWTTPGDPFRRDYFYAYQYQDPASVQAFSRPSPPDTLLNEIPSLQRALSATSLHPDKTTSIDYRKIQGYQEYISRVVEGPANNKAFLENTGGYTANTVHFVE